MGRRKQAGGRPRYSEKTTRTVGTLIEEDFVDRFDEVAEALGLSRSDAIRKAMHDLVAAHPDVPQTQESLLADQEALAS